MALPLAVWRRLVVTSPRARESGPPPRRRRKPRSRPSTTHSCICASIPTSLLPRGEGVDDATYALAWEQTVRGALDITVARAATSLEDGLGAGKLPTSGYRLALVVGGLKEINDARDAVGVLPLRLNNLESGRLRVTPADLAPIQGIG